MGQRGLTIFIIIGAVIFIIFIAGLLVFIFQYRKRKILFDKEKQILALSSILQGQEEERKRIATDLHDGLGSMLSSVKLNLNAMQSQQQLVENDTHQLSKIINQLDKTIVEMRKIAHNMMPEALLKLGFAEAIQDYCNGLNESKAIHVALINLCPDYSFDKSIEIVLYRIVQELINNAIKHAEAKNIIVQISKNENILYLTIEDDGKGFEVGAELSSVGTGLKSVRSRVDYMKGKIEIVSLSKSGTSIMIEIPIPEK